MFILIYKLIFIGIFALIGYTYPPFQQTSQELGAGIGAALALFLTLLVLKIKKSELKHIWSASLGLIGGVAIGWIMFQLFNLIAMSFSAYVFFKALFLFGIPVTGLFIGISKPNMFSPSRNSSGAAAPSRNLTFWIPAPLLTAGSLPSPFQVLSRVN
jgi:hypothetical protein